MSEPLLSVRGLAYSYPGGAQALRGVDFDLLPGECVALLGPNGSGKTTFALHLNGLLSGQGEIRLAGLRLEKRHMTAIRSKVGVVFQDPDEQLFMPTVLEDVAFGLLALGMPTDQAQSHALRALGEVGMEGRAARAPYQLSAGEKRRAALAGVLAMQPELLILDEPTTFLDPPARRHLLDILLALPQAKLVITHDIPFARSLATRAVFFQDGKIAASGPVDEICTRFAWDS